MPTPWREGKDRSAAGPRSRRTRPPGRVGPRPRCKPPSYPPRRRTLGSRAWGEAASSSAMRCAGSRRCARGRTSESRRPSATDDLLPTSTCRDYLYRHRAAFLCARSSPSSALTLAEAAHRSKRCLLPGDSPCRASRRRAGARDGAVGSPVHETACQRTRNTGTTRRLRRNRAGAGPGHRRGSPMPSDSVVRRRAGHGS